MGVCMQQQVKQSCNLVENSLCKVKIVLGISGSVASYKLISLVHELKKSLYDVKVIFTEHASDFVTPATFSSFGADVYTNAIDYKSANDVMGHINLAKWPDMIIIAPATANTIAKLAHGFADNLLTATVLASDKPKIIVPAMNKFMWDNTITKENIVHLIRHGFKVWGPISGLQACGDDGDGRMIEVSEILTLIEDFANEVINESKK